jgi:hypothetical protein
MKITNRKMRKEFALPGHCEWCNRWCRKREGHHLRTRTPEITIRINLISLGSTPLFCCPCHTDIGNGKTGRQEVLLKVAAREGCRPEDIIACMDLFRRVVRPTPAQLARALEELEPAARLLAERELKEASPNSAYEP